MAGESVARLCTHMCSRQIRLRLKKLLTMFDLKITFLFALPATLLVSSLASAQTTNRTIIETVPRPGPTTVQSVPSATTTETVTTAAGLVTEIAPDGFTIRSKDGTPGVRFFNASKIAYLDDTGRPVSRELVTSGLPVTVLYTRVGERLIAERVVVGLPTTVIEKSTAVTRPPVVIEKPVIVEKKVPVVVEKKVYVDRPVIVEKPAPAPVIIEKKTTTTTTTTSEKKDKD